MNYATYRKKIKKNNRLLMWHLKFLHIADHATKKMAIISCPVMMCNDLQLHL